MHILLTVLHAFLMEIVRRIALIIKTAYSLVTTSLILLTWMFEQVVTM